MKKRMLSLSLIMVLVLSLFTFQTAAAENNYEFWDLRNTDNITTTSFDLTVNGKNISITKYTGYYAQTPTPGSTAQRINIFVPSNATANSAILHKVNNSGWMSNSYPTGNVTSSGVDGEALSRGMIIITYGARGRNDNGIGTQGHSPATMTDTKAALRFLRYNMQPGMLLYGKGDPDQVFVTGTSGGGALSVVLSACGDSPDYFPSLYEIGAAGIQKSGNKYSSTISDAYLGTIAYCPITDLPMADQAYEFTYNASRPMRPGHVNANGNLALYEDNTVMQASAWLAGDFASYVNGLSLVDENGVLLTASFDGSGLGGNVLSGVTGGTFKTAMTRLLERGINKAIDERATGYNTKSGANIVDNLDTYSSWLLINGGVPTAGNPAFGSKSTIYNLDQFLTTIPNSVLKIAPAFDNLGLVHAGTQNENNLVGTSTQQYSHWQEWAWNDADTSIAGVGKTNTGLSWDEFLQTDDGAIVALQAKMTTPIPYLLGAANIPYLKYTKGSDECTVAPYWYVRHGHADRDTSFAVDTILYYALLNHDAVDNDFLDLNFAWRQGHGGNYDTAEAFDWLDSVKYEYDHAFVSKDVSASVQKLSGNQNKLTITVNVYLHNGEVIVYKETFSINNNAADTYKVGPYKVYVDTKGNDQIRACYFV